MNTITKFIAGTGFLSLALFAPNVFAVEGEIGINAAVKGDVTIRSGAQAAKQALIKAPIFLGDEVKSASLSSLQVLLKDETVFTVGPDCVLTIDKFVYDPNSNNNSLAASVSKGMFRFMSGNISKTSSQNVSINTPVASMGVRGTIVEGLVGREAVDYAVRAGLIQQGGNVDLEGATLFVLRGPGRRSKARNRKGEISVTSAGQTVTTNRSGYAIFVGNANSAPIGPFLLDVDIFEVFNERLRTRPTSNVSFRPFEQVFFTPIDSGDTGLVDDPIVTDDPGTIFDWPIDENLVGDDCTPANSPDYPNCLR
ncbi:MAG: hypothetical protein COA91_09715 [Robiginitomaculum sp.]|nr:MAG: hypothetical protein COA91_09715 [Robiginitomaculum sp.]